MPTYFIGIGSNIRPEQHVPAAIGLLQGIDKQLVVSRVIRTAPVGLLDSRSFFLNLAVMLECPLSARSLKDELNEIEHRLGRDRSDPNKKVKNRTIDLDILFHLDEWQRTIPPSSLPEEPYLRVPLIELVHTLGYRCPVGNRVMPSAGALKNIGSDELATRLRPAVRENR